MVKPRDKDEQIAILLGTVVTLATGAYNGTMDRPAILAQLMIKFEPTTLRDASVYAAMRRLGCAHV